MSTTRAASNFSINTSWSPVIMLASVAKPLVWYIGAGTRIVWGRGTGAHALGNGSPVVSSITASRSMRITLGVPVDPLLQMP